MYNIFIYFMQNVFSLYSCSIFIPLFELLYWSQTIIKRTSIYFDLLFSLVLLIRKVFQLERWKIKERRKAFQRERK